MALSINRNSIIELLTVISILTCFTSTPYLGHYLFGGAYTLVSGVLAVTIFAASIALFGHKTDSWINILLFFVFSFFLYGAIMMVANSSYDELRKAIGISIKCLYFIGSCYIIKNNTNRFLEKFLKYNAVIVVASIILFFLLLFIGNLWEPISFIKNDGRTHYLYFPLGATNMRLFIGNMTFIRIAGFADEPGALALILTYLIVLNELTVKSVKYRFIFFLGAVLTFSMAFYITVLPIIIYYYTKRTISVNPFKTCLTIFCVIISFNLLVPRNSMVYEGFDKFVFNRFEMNDDGKFNGDNRSEAAPNQISAFKKAPILGVGCSEMNILKYSLGIPSFFSYLGMHGIWGYVFFYIPFLYLCIRFWGRAELLLLISIGLNYLQRPSIEEMFPIICFSVIYYSHFYKAIKIYNQ